MRTTENTKSPMIIIDGGDKKYQVSLDILTEFLDTCKANLGIHGTFDLETSMQEITSIVIDGVDDDVCAGRLKRPLKFLRELDLLFKGLLFEQK